MMSISIFYDPVWDGGCASAVSHREFLSSSAPPAINERSTHAFAAGPDDRARAGSRHRAECAAGACACERLASLSLPNTAITLAQVVNAGAFTVPANPAGRGGGGSSALAGTLGPVPDVPGE